VVKLDWKIQQQRKMLILTMKLHACSSFTYVMDTEEGRLAQYKHCLQL